MKKLLLSLLIGSYFHAFAQPTFSVGVTLSPDINGLSDTYFNSKNEGDFYYKNGLGYQIGIKTRWDFNNFFSIQTGISAVNQQLKTSKFNAIPFFPFTSYSPKPLYIKIETAYKSIHAPLLFSFYFGQNWKIGLSSGFALNYFYINRSNVTEFYQDKIVETEFKNRLNTSNISGIIGTGIEKSLKKYTFRVEPTYGFPIFNINRFEFYDFNKLWTLGLQLSVFYKI